MAFVASLYNGGGLELYGVGNATITNCTFTHNTGPQGGGLYAFNSAMAVSGCTFNNNIASTDTGGGMQNNSGLSATIQNCTFTGNTAIPRRRRNRQLYRRFGFNEQLHVHSEFHLQRFRRRNV